MGQVNAYFDCLTGVTLPVFEHYQEGGDSESHDLIFNFPQIQPCLDKISFYDYWVTESSHLGCVCQVMSWLVWPEEESSSPGWRGTTPELWSCWWSWPPYR